MFGAGTDEAFCELECWVYVALCWVDDEEETVVGHGGGGGWQFD